MRPLCVAACALAAMAAAPPQAGNAAADTQRGDIADSVPPISGAEAIQPGRIYEDWEPIALDYLEALKGPGPIPPGPGNFLVRFADRRPNAHVTPARFRLHLAGCRLANQHIGPSTGLVVHWTCTGPGALGRNVVLALGGYGDRVTEGRVWVGWLPHRLPDDARMW
jgi:hypothetical protein